MLSPAQPFAPAAALGRSSLRQVWWGLFMVTCLFLGAAVVLYAPSAGDMWVPEGGWDVPLAGNEGEEEETNNDNEKVKLDGHGRTPLWDEDVRVAWVVPYIAAPSMPAYAALYLRTVAMTSPYMQLFILYENATMLLPDVRADNIHFVSIRPGEVAERLTRVLKQGLGSVNEAAVQRLFQSKPRKVGAYKPLFGAAFQDVIGNCSHWAWGDIDLLVGDVGRLVNQDDLRAFDIITFNNGAGLLYLQGQLTLLANRPSVNNAWRNARNAHKLATDDPAFAWEETDFAQWALHNSDLRIKLQPLQFSGHAGRRWSAGDGNALIWERGRVLLHARNPQPEGPGQRRLEAPYLWQDTWTPRPQRPGPYILERLGSDQTCVWQWSDREAPGYDRRTQEFIIFHFNYEHEDGIPSALAKKSPDEMRALLATDRVTWRYSPFDFVESPPCGSGPEGGPCPLSQQQTN